MLNINRKVYILSKERQLRRQEEIRQKILDIARDIVTKEGIQGLSIRKITNAIDYSPAIIYHYFKDKNEIIELLVKDGYKRILDSISSVKRNEDEPEKELREAFDNYIRAALESPEVYKAVVLSDDPSILTKTSILKKGITKDSKTFKLLYENLRRGIEKKKYLQYDIELTAQIVWTATFGLIIKLIIEKDISTEQVNRLIDHLFNILFKGIMIRKEVL